MGWNNPPIPWGELERRLSDRPTVPPEDGPGSRKRKPYKRKAEVRRPDEPVTPYAELHAHSNFSFLDGASGPDRLVEAAIELGLHGLALTDHDGFYGAPLFAEIAQKYAAENLRTVYGAELSLGLDAPQNGVPDPRGRHLLVLARGVDGYHRLAGAITEAQLRGDEKGKPVYDLDELADTGRGHWLVLTGCRKGTVRSALGRSGGGPAAAAAELDRLTSMFGRDHVVVELFDHGHPSDDDVNRLLAGLAADRGLPVVATNNVHYADPGEHRLASAMAAIRARRSLAEMNGWLPAWGAASLRTGREMAAKFAGYPGAVARSVQLADDIAFDLHKASPRLPKEHIPEGHTAMSWLRVLVDLGFQRHYRGKKHEREARERVDYELAIIDKKDFAGYFVIVHDIVAYARDEGILCQGRGSAASSAVCYALGVTAIDPVFHRLPFERFISVNRDEEPDIDVDFDSDRREEVIQWVYDRYGRRNAAQVANVISYRPKMAVRDAAKALGYSPGQQDAWSKQVDSWSAVAEADADGHGIPVQVVGLANQLMRAPRHLGIHSGGMILTERPIGQVCPIERGRMDKRTVLQWDKDACESMGLVKFDLLGLGMLSALNHAFTLVAGHLGEAWELQSVPKEEPAVYDMLCRGDSIGVFQVESRAQIGTLPRLRPREFYDLAIEIALIRPGPIQGGAVHPYIRRATGQEKVEYAHPDLEPVLERTLGVPLFQEQLMGMAMAVGDCTPDDADLLRRAMGSKRGIERIESIKEKLYKGMARRGITGAGADALYTKILSFANFGFAESHALSFAKLVYVSSWLKLHYPAAFLAALLRAQPMGFYSPQSLVHDARRHGVTVLRPDIALSGATAGLELEPGGDPRATGRAECLVPEHGRTDWLPGTPDPTPEHRRDTGYAVRLGLDSVRGISTDVAEAIVEARADRPFRDPTDLSRRAGLDARQLEALATAGAFDGFGLTRREALWNAGYVETADQLEAVTATPAPPPLPGMSDVELTLADLWATSISPDGHPLAHLRPLLRREGILAVDDLATAEPNRRVTVAGVVTHRQRPGTAGGITFLNIEDETGMVNVVCGGGLWQRHRRVARNAACMIVRGILERKDGVINLVADKLASLAELHPEAARALHARHRSRDFH
ncbi:error-prone DNA polymerase [Jiangella rhizosphaerae]|uniref:Error-prone DNA polymerase n=1 Tax=Jiangella rhizosphaerae TaxID=2293569 RepID=A0A418KJA5_9ACTN|nr:error-prone DNA polymerase [Jiangella rhizosphaerae]RIQ14455.1 error-prone DNA polymerase [Jiangella rhizosphaerae]